MSNWAAWAMAGGVIVIVVWYFWQTGAAIVTTIRRLRDMVQNWPQIRRDMTEAEVRAGGRYPVWFRAARVILIMALIALALLLVWRKLTAA